MVAMVRGETFDPIAVDLALLRLQISDLSLLSQTIFFIQVEMRHPESEEESALLIK